MRKRYYGLIALLVMLLGVPLAHSKEAYIYQVVQPLDMGDGSGPPPKDLFVTLGKRNGLKVGTLLEVFRRTPTFDLTINQLSKDVTFRVGTLKVIHVDEEAAIARLDRFIEPALLPALSSKAILVGDLVRPKP